MKIDDVIPTLQAYVDYLIKLRNETTVAQRVFDLGNRANNVKNAIRFLERSLVVEAFPNEIAPKKAESSAGLEQKVKAPHEAVQAKGRRKGND